eukprot:13377115-Alexandrium_andersonii.AAC.1
MFYRRPPVLVGAPSFFAIVSPSARRAFLPYGKPGAVPPPKAKGVVVPPPNRTRATAMEPPPPPP